MLARALKPKLEKTETTRERTAVLRATGLLLFVALDERDAGAPLVLLGKLTIPKAAGGAPFSTREIRPYTATCVHASESQPGSWPPS
jgi:hypothetical protein